MNNVLGNFKNTLTWLLLSLCLVFQSTVFAENHTLDLVIHRKTVNFANKTRNAIAVNDQIPGPTLHFKEGDHVTLNVCNQLGEGTTLHWHGILVPWQMDGVEGVAQRAIPAGETFQYRFTLLQSGTYWYHAHAGIQEQEGLYGAFLIDPACAPPYHYSKDYVVVLSDWSNIPGQNVLMNLKKDGDYYSPRFPLQPSLKKFIHDMQNASEEEQKRLLNDYKMMQKSRMSLYDLSDVAYDAYLINGCPKSCPWTAPVKVGDVVRLRFIGAAASTIYRIKIPGSKMKMIHIQGNDVMPDEVEDFSIAPGETTDVLVTIKKNAPHIIYAESIDTYGIAVGGLVTHPNQTIDYCSVPPFPEPKPVTREMMANSMMVKKHHNNSLSHPSHPSTNAEHRMGDQDHSMNMPSEASIIGDSICPPNAKSSKEMTLGTKYQNLKAAVKTNDPNKPVDGIIQMELFGYMDRFIWMINGLPEYKAHPISIEQGKRYRIIFSNHSMMHHPMHLHGHWFILRNGNAAYDPLLHTIDMPPGAIAVADIDTDASGQWFFHCHHLYHMMSGMSRVFQYHSLVEVEKGELKPQKIVKKGSYINRPIIRIDRTKPLDHALIHHPLGHNKDLYLANFLDLGEDPFHNVQKWTFKGLYGDDYNKLELLSVDGEVDKGKIEEADLDIFYWRLISQFWAIKGGVNYFYRPSNKPYWQPGIGIEGLMPYFIETNLRLYAHRGSAKLDAIFARDSQLTRNFFLGTEIRGIFATKTVVKDEIGSGVNQLQSTIRPFYRLTTNLFLFMEYEHTQYYGVLKKIRNALGASVHEDVLTFGVSVVF